MPNSPKQFAHQAVLWPHLTIYGAPQKPPIAHKAPQVTPVTMGWQRRTVHVRTATKRELKGAPRLVSLSMKKAA